MPTPPRIRLGLLFAGLASAAVGLAIVLWVFTVGLLEADADSRLPPSADPPSASDAGSTPAPPPVHPRIRERRAMVEEQLRRRDITNPRVLDAMLRVPRHRFVPDEHQTRAYEDHPLPIGHGQTISQPYIVALMTQLVAPKPGDRVLDVGVGSGYQTAVLAELCKDVYGVEIVEPLAAEAAKRLKGLGYANVQIRQGDGYQGGKEHAPFDAIVVAASPDRVPQPLIDQLAPGGRMAIPVGGYPQQLTLVVKDAQGAVRQKKIAPVMFVPMTGEAQRDQLPPK